MTVTLLTKPGCLLCDEVQETIERVGREIPFTMAIRNILDDLGDYERYKHDIPVVLLDGREIARHRMSEDEFCSALLAGGVGGTMKKGQDGVVT